MTFQSEMIDELCKSLSKAQANISVAIEDKKNPHFKSSYASLNSIWDSCREALTNEGLCVTQTTEPTAECIYLVTTLFHSSGQWIKSKLPISSSTISPQQLGSVITYFRRYSLASIVGVAPGEDDDAESVKQQSIPLNEPAVSKSDIQKFKQKFGIGHQSEYEKYLNAISSKKNKSQEEMVVCACMNEQGFVEAFNKWQESIEKAAKQKQEINLIPENSTE